jgi:hypothetical protein
MNGWFFVIDIKVQSIASGRIGYAERCLTSSIFNSKTLPELKTISYGFVHASDFPLAHVLAYAGAAALSSACALRPIPLGEVYRKPLALLELVVFLHSDARALLHFLLVQAYLKTLAFLAL